MATHTLPLTGDSGPAAKEYHAPDRRQMLTGAAGCPLSEMHSVVEAYWELSHGALDARNAIPYGGVRGLDCRTIVFGIDFDVRFYSPPCEPALPKVIAPEPEPPNPCPAIPALLSDGERRALQRRLDRWELDHLRQHAAALAERIEKLETEAADLRRARDDAEDRAGFWHDQAIGYYQDEQERGAVVGLAIDGTLSIVRPAPPATHS